MKCVERRAFIVASLRPGGDALEARHQALPRLDGHHGGSVARWHPRSLHPRLGFRLRRWGDDAHLPVCLGRGLAAFSVAVSVLIIVRRSRLTGVARVAPVAAAAVAGTPLRPVDVEIALAMAEAVGFVLRPGSGVDGLARVSLEVDAHAETDCAATYENSAPIGVGAIYDGPRLVRLPWVSGDLSACPRPI